MSKNLHKEEFQPISIRFEALEDPPKNIRNDVKLVFDWAKELKAARHTGNSESWWLAGRAVILLSEDIEYCQRIIKGAAWYAGFHFYMVNASSISNTLKTLKNLNFESPYLLYITPGPWMFDTEPNLPGKELKQLSEIRSIIKSLITVSNPPSGGVVVSSIANEDYCKIDESFRQIHFFNRRFLIAEPSPDEIAAKFISNIGEDLCDETLTAKAQAAGNLLKLEFNNERRQALIALGLKRLAAREKRKVGYNDLLYFVANGSAEFAKSSESNSDNAYRVAIHEAGHAAIAMIDSEGQDIPEYVSIMETNDFKGVMIDSIAYQYSKTNIMTYRKFRHKIRVALAGRVAEHLVLGSENVGCAAARSDLENATGMAGAMFALYGISHNMEDSDTAAQNLIVLCDAREATALDSQRIDQMVNIYLEKQYKWGLNVLQTQLDLLNVITQKLINKKVLYQEELSSIFNQTSSTKFVASDMMTVEK